MRGCEQRRMDVRFPDVDVEAGAAEVARREELREGQLVAPSGEFTPNNVQTPEERSEIVVRVRVTLEEGQESLRPGVSADGWFEE